MPYDYDSHIIPTPKFLIFIQALTVLTAAAVIGLSSYALSFNGPDHGNGWANGVVSFSGPLQIFFLPAKYHTRLLQQCLS